MSRAEKKLAKFKAEEELKLLKAKKQAEQKIAHQDKEWYTHGWGLAVAILFFPYFLVWYVWAKSKWSKNIKIAITAVVAIVMLPVMIGVITTDTTTPSSSNQGQKQSAKEIKDYSNQDAKVAYDELIADGHTVKFTFDRNNNGGFSESDFQAFVLNDFNSYGNSIAKQYPGENMGNKTDSIWVVTKQDNDGDKRITLYLEYASIIERDKQQANKEEVLEKKLSIVSAMTACQQYGKRNYRDFKMHSILGKVAERASDDDTWFLKYRVDADGYKDKAMECYVTGTTSSPEVSEFHIY